ncbi:hypothetical protein ACOMHN_016885 [Nucella lapillus]
MKEAHPQDLWPLPSNKQVFHAHRCLKDRLQSASALVAHESVREEEILVDSMDDGMAQLYAASPARLLVIQDGELTYLGGCAPAFYRPEEVREVLRGHVQALEGI